MNDRLASSQERLGSAPERHRLIRKLESIADLTTDDKEALLALPMTVKSLAADQDIVRDKDRPSQCCLILEGFVCRYKLLDGGKRQIMSFHTPGDFPDLQSLHLKVMDHSVGTLVPSKLAFIPHASIRDVIRRHPVLNDALWRDTLVDAAIFREWMVGLGRREAYARIAHLMCEMLVRFKAVGLTNDHAYELPITQGRLARASPGGRDGRDSRAVKDYFQKNLVQPVRTFRPLGEIVLARARARPRRRPVRVEALVDDDLDPAVLAHHQDPRPRLPGGA